MICYSIISQIFSQCKKGKTFWGVQLLGKNDHLTLTVTQSHHLYFYNCTYLLCFINWALQVFLVWRLCPLSFNPPPDFTVHTRITHRFPVPAQILMMCIYCSYMYLLTLSVFKNYPLLFCTLQRKRHWAFSREQQEQVYRLHPGKVNLSFQPYSAQLVFFWHTPIFNAVILVRCASWRLVSIAELFLITFAVIQRPWLGCPDPFMRV